MKQELYFLLVLMIGLSQLLLSAACSRETGPGLVAPQRPPAQYQTNCDRPGMTNADKIQCFGGGQ